MNLKWSIKLYSIFFDIFFIRGDVNEKNTDIINDKFSFYSSCFG